MVHAHNLLLNPSHRCSSLFPTHTQLMHTDLQVLVWQYSHEVEYKFLGEVSTLLGFNKYITVVTLIFVIPIFRKWCLDQHLFLKMAR